jgi:hypothetical protein
MFVIIILKYWMDIEKEILGYVTKIFFSSIYRMSQNQSFYVLAEAVTIKSNFTKNEIVFKIIIRCVIIK